MAKQYFGTDGIRGTVGQEPITPDFMLRLGWAVGQVLGQSGSGRNLFVLGKDTRVSGYMFESAIQAGLIASGADVALVGPMPTPAIAYLARTFKAKAGIVISASHNSFEDNGIKFFSGEGYKLDDDIELQIERKLQESFQTADSKDLGKASRITDAAGRYIEYCKSSLPRELNLSKFRIVLDCAHGATYHIAPKVFEELGAVVTCIGVSPDGRNINLNCGATDTAALQQKVLEEKATLGIAFDGDGDRVQFVDCNGGKVNGDELILIIAKYLHQENRLKGVVGTLMSNFGMQKALEQMCVPFVRASVGDRYVIEAMNENGYELGGEASGHLICAEKSTTGDGIVAALQVLEALDGLNLSLEQGRELMTKYPQLLLNVPISRKIRTIENDAITNAVKLAETMLADSGRVVLRPSGTEPLIRVMVEGDNAELVRDQCQRIADIVKSELG